MMQDIMAYFPAPYLEQRKKCDDGSALDLPETLGAAQQWKILTRFNSRHTASISQGMNHSSVGIICMCATLRATSITSIPLP